MSAIHQKCQDCGASLHNKRSTRCPGCSARVGGKAPALPGRKPRRVGSQAQTPLRQLALTFPDTGPVNRHD